MTTLVSIDPGLRECGVATFKDGTLVDAWLARCNLDNGPKQWVAMAQTVLDHVDLHDCDELVIEYMQTRRGRRDAHDALIQLSLVSGGIYCLVDEKNLGNVKLVHAPANTWTGRRPKKVNHNRVWSRLGLTEVATLEEGLTKTPKKNHKELLDAVGIGLWHLKRL